MTLLNFAKTKISEFRSQTRTQHYVVKKQTKSVSTQNNLNNENRKKMQAQLLEKNKLYTLLQQKFNNKVKDANSKQIELTKRNATIKDLQAQQKKLSENQKAQLNKSLLS